MTDAEVTEYVRWANGEGVLSIGHRDARLLVEEVQRLRSWYKAAIIEGAKGIIERLHDQAFADAQKTRRDAKMAIALAEAYMNGDMTLIKRAAQEYREAMYGDPQVDV